MWWTPDGERILRGAEARLFTDALGALVNMVRDDHESLWQFGAPPFDDLQPNQKLAVLAQIGTALLRKDRPMPRLSAVLEAAVGAVYETVRVMVEKKFMGIDEDYYIAVPPDPTDEEMVGVWATLRKLTGAGS